MSITKGRYIYHYYAETKEERFAGIAQLDFRIITQNDIKELKKLISKNQFNYSNLFILNISYLGREFED